MMYLTKCLEHAKHSKKCPVSASSGSSFLEHRVGFLEIISVVSWS